MTSGPGAKTIAPDAPRPPRIPARPLPLEPAPVSELARRRVPPEPPRPSARGTDAPPRAADPVDVLEVIKPSDALAKLPAVPPTLPRITQMKSA